MSDIDNAGGIILAEYVFPSEVLAMFYMNNGVRIVLNSGKNWKTLPHANNKISVDTTPSEDDPGTVYDTKVSIVCPSNRVTSADKIYFEQLKLVGMILRYTLSTGEMMISGQQTYPLRGTVKRITPGKMSDFAGHQLDFAAKNTVDSLTYLP
jgi:hypothetical protein